jgi:hypothetical protein
LGAFADDFADGLGAFTDGLDAFADGFIGSLVDACVVGCVAGFVEGFVDLVALAGAFSALEGFEELEDCAISSS